MRTHKIAKNSTSAHHGKLCRAVSSQLRHARIDNRKKNLLDSNIFSACFHNKANVGELTAEIRLPVWVTPAHFNGFRVLASHTAAVRRRRSSEANQTLHNVWSSPGLVHYIYIFGGSCPLTEFCQVQHSLYVHKSCVLLYWQRYCMVHEQRPSAKLCGLVRGMELRNFRRRRHCIFGWAAITLRIGQHSSQV